MNSQTGRVILRRFIRRGDDWRVYEGLVSGDEQWIYVSYHGTATTGADWGRLTKRRLVMCPVRSGRIGCIKMHGGIEPYGSYLLAATGDPPWILMMSARGRVIGTIDTLLAGNHLMEFAADPRERDAYAIGSCGYAGGLSAVDLQSGRARIIASAAPMTDPEELRPGACGERIVFAGGDLLLIAKTRRPVPERRRSGAVLLVKRPTGDIIQTVPTHSEPIDVIAW